VRKRAEAREESPFPFDEPEQKAAKSPFRAGSMHWLRIHSVVGGGAPDLFGSVKVLSSLQLKLRLFSQRRCRRRCWSKSASLLN
jgi:hypothetical protein